MTLASKLKVCIVSNFGIPVEEPSYTTYSTNCLFNQIYVKFSIIFKMR